MAMNPCLTACEVANTFTYWLCCTWFASICKADKRTVYSGGPIVFSTLSNIILMLRIHALYNRSRRGKWLCQGPITGILIVHLYSPNNSDFSVCWCVIQDSLRFCASYSHFFQGQFIVCPLSIVVVPPDEAIGRILLCNTKQPYICYFPWTWYFLARLLFIKILPTSRPNGLVSDTIFSPYQC